MDRVKEGQRRLWLSPSHDNLYSKYRCTAIGMSGPPALAKPLFYSNINAFKHVLVLTSM